MTMAGMRRRAPIFNEYRERWLAEGESEMIQATTDDAPKSGAITPAFCLGYRPYTMEHTVIDTKTGFAVSVHATRVQAEIAMRGKTRGERS